MLSKLWQKYQPMLVANLSHSYFFLRFFLRNIREQHALQTASSLAYTTLLSIVPLITVMFSIFGQLSILGNLSDSIQSFIFNNFVPAFGSTVQEYMLEFSSKASKLTLTGIVILIVIALMLMATIDNAFNRIWLVKKRRRPLARLLVYWAMITMGPLLIGIGLFLTSSLLTLPLITDVDSSWQLQAKLLRAAPFLTTSIAFTLVYMIVPNCYVPKRHAMIGGVTAAVLFEMAKYAFGIYVKTMPTYQNIYGAIAVVPLFLVWIYVSWVIVLIGSHLSYCLSTFQLQEERAGQRTINWDFLDVLYILNYLWQKQIQGEVSDVQDMRRYCVRLPRYQVMEILELLHKKKWVHRLNDDEWSLARDVNQISLLDLHRDLPCRLPQHESLRETNAIDRCLIPLLQNYEQACDSGLNVTLQQVFTHE